MTPEQQNLLQRARESLDAARLLLQQGYAGFAASRAYYTMFYVAEAFLLGQELSFSKHSAVIAAFGRQFTKTGQVPPEFHRYLIDATEVRHAGDYGGKSVDSAEADLQIARAEQFLNLAERLIGSISTL
jgi:uncharacterized protein (UPF0332 family)